MKRSDALKLIANQLNFLSGEFVGYKTEFSYAELKKADVILTSLESAGMQPPPIETKFWNRQDNDFHYVNEWEPESEVNVKEGIWCRMCGGACDLENCGMEQP